MSEARGADSALLDRSPDSAPLREAARRPAERVLIESLFDLLLPASHREAEVGVRNRDRFMVGALVLAGGVAVSMLVGRAGQGVPSVLAYAGVLLCLATGLLVSFRFGARRAIVSNATIGLFYGGSVSLVIASGGESPPAVMAASLVPIVAYGIRGQRAAIGWTVAVLAGIAATAAYAATTSEFLYRGEMLAWTEWRITSMILMVGFMLLAALGVDWMRKRSEVEATELQAQLQHQGERFRDLVENVGDCMMEFDDRFRCLYASPNWMELTGRPIEDLLGRGYVDCLHPDDDPEIRRQNAELLANPGTTFKYKARVQHVRGHWISGEVCSRTFYDRSGALKMVAIFRDLSELYRTQRALRHNDRLATAGTLAAGIAHQINNPIGAIRNAAEFGLLSAKDGEIDEVERVLESNVEQAARCGEIVRGLLQFASREHRDTKVLDLRPVVERACSFARGYRGETPVEVVVESGPSALPVEISEVEIEQVIVNLVQNAIQAAPVSRRVDVAVRSESGQATVEVRDDGRGISDIDVEQVFDPFFTTRLAEGGSGLGLSIALGIARDHGGDLEVESGEGEGTRVRLRLPLDGAIARA